MSDQVTVAALPLCDFCEQTGVKRLAEYDAKTVQGPWANMCHTHFGIFSVSALTNVSLGTGIGQRLVLAKEEE